nr:MAG TPA: hypothetical protein [Caudoviricetes sp.]
MRHFNCFSVLLWYCAKGEKPETPHFSSEPQ